MLKRKCIIHTKITLKAFSILTLNGCWKFTGVVGNRGYGEIRHLRKRWMAHRLSYTLYVGKIPKGLFVCHKCDNPLCINPKHLFIGSSIDNTTDMIKKKRHNFFGLKTKKPSKKNLLLLIEFLAEYEKYVKIKGFKGLKPKKK